MGRREVGLRVRTVADASGRATFLGRQFKLKVPDPVFNQYAIHTWFDGLDRAARPELADALRSSQRVRPFRPEGDYSYAMRAICGDRWLLIGDAARFADLIFSSGVSVAMNSARLASYDIIAAAENGDFGKPAFTAFETKLRRAVRNW